MMEQVPRPTPSPCRTKDCDREGFGGLCWKHTPDEGSGVTLCLGCMQPVKDHPLTGDSQCWIEAMKGHPT